MLPRGLTEEEFKEQTVQEYLQGDYKVDRAMADELAQIEWDIRQEVESNSHRLKKVELKEKNTHPGFGDRGIAMHRAKEIKAGSQVLRMSPTAYRALKTKAILTKADVEWLFCGDDDFLPKYAKGLNFPNYMPRFGGFRTWAVYEWIDYWMTKR